MVLIFQIVYLEKVGQGHRLQFSQLHHWMANIKISVKVLRCIFAVALIVSEISTLKIVDLQNVDQGHGVQFSQLRHSKANVKTYRCYFLHFGFSLTCDPCANIDTDTHTHTDTDTHIPTSTQRNGLPLAVKWSRTCNNYAASATFHRLVSMPSLCDRRNESALQSTVASLTAIPIQWFDIGDTPAVGPGSRRPGRVAGCRW